MAQVNVTAQAVEIAQLTVDDPVVRQLLTGQQEERWPWLVERALSIGARGLTTMGLGMDVAHLDAMVQRTVGGLLTEAQDHVESVLEAARQAFAAELDPELRSSTISQALDDLSAWRESLRETVDLELADSHTARFLRQLEQLVGPGGNLEQRLTEALDPSADGSALSNLASAMSEKLDQLRDLVVEQRGRQQEAALGTRKGFDFEDGVESWLRQAAHDLGGCVVERTSRIPGRLGERSIVGDLVVMLSTGERIVVEAKDVARIALGGREGILDELDRAMANREAQFGVCVSAQDAYPAEVGGFGSYGNRLLVVEPGGGMMTGVALRWCAAALAAQTRGADVPLDVATITAKLQDIRALAQLFSSNRRSLTDIGHSIEKVRASLGELRGRLVSLSDELLGELALPASLSALPAKVLELRPDSREGDLRRNASREGTSSSPTASSRRERL